MFEYHIMCPLIAAWLGSFIAIFSMAVPKEVREKVTEADEPQYIKYIESMRK